MSSMNIEANIAQVAKLVQRYLAGFEETGQRHRHPDEPAGGWWPPCPQHHNYHPLRAQVI